MGTVFSRVQCDDAFALQVQEECPVHPVLFGLAEKKFPSCQLLGVLFTVLVRTLGGFFYEEDVLKQRDHEAVEPDCNQC